ncbi:MAG: hypothetical protein K6G03_09010 [Lachnospiraceae bacterium]|nr:hypothetical protein [Lachnospiraceae bacterium]
MSPVVGHIIVIAFLILLVAVCLKQIIGDLKNGSCSGCDGGCASCKNGCSGSDEMRRDISEEIKASEILKNIERPKNI